MTKKSDTPIYDAVRKYAEKTAGRFHTPGHSGGKNLPPFFSFAKYDITELSFSDNLENPTSVILHSEQKTASVFGVKRSLYFTSGATTALFAAVYALKNFVKKAVICANCHKSVFNALTTFNVEFEVAPSSADRIPDFLKNSDANLFIYTSPDYFGCIFEKEKELCSFCRENGIYTICDEAHGSHFVFSSLFPTSSCSIADMTVDSLHKTLPVQTGGAVLNVKNEKLVPLAENARKTLNTTSPSYITLASMDFAVGYMATHGEKLYKNLKKKVEKTILSLNELGVETKPSDDFTRLVLCIKYTKTMARALESFGVYPEGYTPDGIVFIITPFNSDSLNKIPLFFKNNKRFIRKAKPIHSNNEKAFSARQSDQSELVPLVQAAGRISFENVGFYPPAVPFVEKGEVFTVEKVKALLRADKTFGLYGDKVSVYKSPLKQ